MDGNFETVTLVHVQLNHPVGMYPPGHDFQDYLGVESWMVATEFRITDARKLVKLPKRLVLKGINNRFLGHRREANHNHNKFDDGEIALDTAEYRIIGTTQGYIQVKSQKTGKLWVPENGNWICSEWDENESNPSAWFEAVKVGPNKIALRSYSLNKFCTPLTREGRTNCLNAAVNTITKAAHFDVLEPLLSREVQVTHFRFNDARIYNERIVAVITKEAYNRTTSTDTQTLSFSADTVRTGHWSNSESLTVTENFGFTAAIPKAGLGFEFSVEGIHSDKYTWGGSIQRSNTITSSSQYTVPCMTRITVRMMVKAITYEIPFSYIQADVYSDGTSDRQSYQDGIYTGANAYDFTYETSSERLTETEFQGSSSFEDFSLPTVNKTQLIPIWPVSTVTASIPTTDDDADAQMLDSELPTVDAPLPNPDDAEMETPIITA
ncbi:uncharacterized protein LOC141608264 [Silene latifolia]|uniref:uncharacterized protein LOC141608264 n=1 Tax=Silene latifolia TaxID=37657 RepID=UPI003D771C50